MNVLSLFNGMNTGRIALENVGIKVNKYYSSEIKPYAIELTQHHHPDTIQVGDVTKWEEWDIDYSTIDLVLSGSPCQDLSIAGKRKGIRGERSGLFFTFVDILNHIKGLNPDVLFLQENVGSAPRGDIGIMSREMGVYPVRINSSLLTAQLRDRYYWSNIITKPDGLFGDIVTAVPQPEDRKIILRDIIKGGEVNRSKSVALLERTGEASTFKDMKGEKAQRYLRIRAFKYGFITTVKEDGFYRLFNQNELECLQGFPEGYTEILSYNKASSLLGDGWTLPIIEHIFSYIKGLK